MTASNNTDVEMSLDDLWGLLTKDDSLEQLLTAYNEIRKNHFDGEPTLNGPADLKRFLSFGNLIVLTIFVLARSKGTYVAFYDNENEPLQPQAEEKISTKTLQNAGNEIARISNASLVSSDATESIQKLLDHISYERMKEEGDAISYLNSLSKRYENSAAKLNVIRINLEKIQAFKAVTSDSVKWSNCKNKFIHSNVNTEDEKNALDKLEMDINRASEFLKQFFQFCRYSSEQISTFLDRISHRDRIETIKRFLYSISRNSTSAAPLWQIGMLFTMLTAMIGSGYLLVSGNNISTKGYLFPVITISGIMIFLLFKKIQIYSSKSKLGIIHRNIKNNIFSIFNTKIKTPKSVNSNIKKLYSIINNLYYKFAPYPDEFKFHIFSLARIQPFNSSKMENLKKRFSWSRRFGRWLGLFFLNLVALAFVLVVPFALSYPTQAIAFLKPPLQAILGHSWPPEPTFHAFISQDANGNRCLLQHGKVLYATGSAYYLMRPDNDGIAKVLKSTVLSVEASNVMQKYQIAGKLPNCLSVRKTDAQPKLTDAAILEAANAVTQANTGLTQSLKNIGKEVSKLAKAPICEGNCGVVTAPQAAMIVAPIVVQPATISSTSTSPSEVAQAPRFFTTIVANGAAQSMKSILLPLFSRKVENGIEQTQQAYAFGKERNLVDPLILENNSSFIDSIAYSMRVCSDTTSKAYNTYNQKNGTQFSPEPIELTVLGYATATAFSKELNHHLAEGRRIAVIKKLKTALGDRIKITNEPPAEYLSMLDDPANPGVIPQKYMQFKTYKAMETSLKSWLNQIPGKVREELLGRSVIIEFDNDALRHCGVAPLRKSGE